MILSNSRHQVVMLLVGTSKSQVQACHAALWFSVKQVDFVCTLTFHFDNCGSSQAGYSHGPSRLVSRPDFTVYAATLINQLNTPPNIAVQCRSLDRHSRANLYSVILPSTSRSNNLGAVCSAILGRRHNKSPQQVIYLEIFRNPRNHSSSSSLLLPACLAILPLPKLNSSKEHRLQVVFSRILVPKEHNSRNNNRSNSRMAPLEVLAVHHFSTPQQGMCRIHPRQGRQPSFNIF